VLIGKQPPLGFKPVLVGPPFGPAAFLPKPICELTLFPYIELRAHDSSSSVWTSLITMPALRMHGLCQRLRWRGDAAAL
jgi:hypothetical protein